MTDARNGNRRFGKGEWRAVPGYEGLYLVSDHGVILSSARTIVQVNRWGKEAPRNLSAKFLAQTPDKSPHGYGRLTVKLSKDGKAKTHLVHRLVAAAFLGPCPDGMQVAHCDGDPTNNHVSNLRYATPLENTGDKFLHGTVLRGSCVGNAKLNEAQVRKIKRAKGTVYEIAAEFGISIAHVSRIRSGKRWRHVQ